MHAHVSAVEVFRNLMRLRKINENMEKVGKRFRRMHLQNWFWSASLKTKPKYFSKISMNYCSLGIYFSSDIFALVYIPIYANNNNRQTSKTSIQYILCIMLCNASEIFLSLQHVLKRINPVVIAQWERKWRFTKKVNVFWNLHMHQWRTQIGKLSY